MTPQPIPAHHPEAGIRRLFAWAVHGYTALGAVIAFVATIAILNGRYRDAFLLMVVATTIDATDGVLARRARVKEVTPAFDGARLDDIVDYLTFVFVPVLLLYHAGDLPATWGMWVAGVILMSSAYGFSSTDAKTEDYFFTGFPSYWNIVALYLHAGRLPAGVNAAILLVLSALIFVRIGYVYPTRTPVLRGLTIALCVIWSLMIVAIIWMLPDVATPARTERAPGAPVSALLLVASLFFPVYYTVLSLTLNARRGPRT